MRVSIEHKAKMKEKNAFHWIGRFMRVHPFLSVNFWMIQLFGYMTMHTTDNLEVHILRFITVKYNAMLQQEQNLAKWVKILKS